MDGTKKQMGEDKESRSSRTEARGGFRKVPRQVIVTGRQEVENADAVIHLPTWDPQGRRGGRE